jgi:mutator protein MutT
MGAPVIDVAAGLLFHRGLLLITQRPPGGHLAGCWEFPGGKRLPSETWPECLRRELLEEIGVDVVVGPLFEECVHDYPDRTIRIRFYFCSSPDPRPQAIQCARWAWVRPGDLDGYMFPEADAALVSRLQDPAFPAWSA